MNMEAITSNFSCKLAKLVEEKSTSIDIDKGVDVSTGKPHKETNVGVSKDGVSASTGGKGTSVHVVLPKLPGPAPYGYYYGATADRLHDNPDVALFFLEKDMKLGMKMPSHFTKATNAATFLPRQVSKQIPFSSNKLPEILNHFPVKPNSMEAKIMKTSNQRV
ncbi:hypothetical protein CsSME_00049196 [Camellia sinensis var. sinensis]